MYNAFTLAVKVSQLSCAFARCINPKEKQSSKVIEIDFMDLGFYLC